MTGGQIEEALAGLDGRERRVLDAALHGSKYRQIAERFGVSPAEAARVLRSALIRMRCVLDVEAVEGSRTSDSPSDSPSSASPSSHSPSSDSPATAGRTSSGPLVVSATSASSAPGAP